MILKLKLIKLRAVEIFELLLVKYGLEYNGIEHRSEAEQNVCGQQIVDVELDAFLGVRFAGVSHDELLRGVFQFVVNHGLVP